ncbi:serine hydrolase [Nonomuraea zeae]|nr:serine hydrolase [Nonomuraea zeae]
MAIPRLVIVLALILPLVSAPRRVPAEIQAALPAPRSSLAPIVRQALPDRTRTQPETARQAPLGKIEQSLGTELLAEIPAKEIGKRLDRYVAGRSATVTAMVKDLATGRLYRYHPGERLITASSAKVQILMALLLKTPWKKLPADVRHDAEMMIRYSDNHAADRLWLRVGGAAGFTKAGRTFGLKHTQGVPGDCVDLYCWGITRTSVDDQIRLMQALVSGKSPLKTKDRDQVLKLMGEVIDGQNWGIGVAACEGDRVAVKNGWLKRVSTKLWATISVGLIRGDGHDYAIAVLTEGSPEVGYGIATVEGVTKRIMQSFRKCRD